MENCILLVVPVACRTSNGASSERTSAMPLGGRDKNVFTLEPEKGGPSVWPVRTKICAGSSEAPGSATAHSSMQLVLRASISHSICVCVWKREKGGFQEYELIAIPSSFSMSVVRRKYGS